MAWDASKFIAEYRAGECENTRCLNRLDMLVEQSRELLEAREMLVKIMGRAKGGATSRELYALIANFNLGHREP